MKNKKKLGRAVLLACLFATSLSACSLFKNKEEKTLVNQPVKTSQIGKYVAQKSSIKKDKTTEVLVDAEIKKEDIVKIAKHGDHWHVFTKDGREKITYTDPSKMESINNFDMVSVVGKSQLKNKDVVAIKKHDDHYHVYLADGTEYLTYENPSALFPNIPIGTYVGSHSSQNSNWTKAEKRAQNIKVKERLERDDERVIKILKHGDHYHIYTSKGNEFVTYEDPRGLYPNASYGIYQGSHGNRKEMIAKILKEDKEKQVKNKRKIVEKKPEKLQKDKKLIKVEDEKKTHNVVKILKHGDHYHIYTKDGDEYISYTNPSSLYPDIPIGTYHGSHGDVNKEKNKKPTDDKKENPKKPDQYRPGQTGAYNKSRIENLKITNILGKEKVDRYDIVKILKHGDHYHIYDSKGREGVTYENPQDIYPKANFGQYEGSHGNNKDDKKDFTWPEGITKIIDHGDHWHLYRGDKEVGVVTENPKSHYPDAEYINDSKDYSHVEVNDGDLFSYESVKGKKIAGIERVFDDRFKLMENYGKITDGKAAFGPGGQYKGGDVFYWLHGDHYHYLSIKDLIKMEKAGELGNFTAKDIVSTLKYKMENPEVEIGKDYDDEKSEILRYNIITFLKRAYPESDVSNIELNFYVYGSEDLVFHISDFEEVDGKVVYKNGNLPVMKKEEKDKSDGKEQEESSEDKKEDNIENKEEKESKDKEEKKEIDPAEKQENLEKAQDGYENKEKAEIAAKKALESDFANNDYDIIQGPNGRWFYNLKVS
ncbi:DUF5633 domain-containing protein [Anaerococcus sp.]|uniref:DUF5633 domain-containing protein n=1 Tax=Anaerococcus sp. TaxID=1872515 RepID=UPI002A75DF65|nr:DUF5633 domain-containing protein [Anaerococcus sp.]MDY2927035.1 DUF5633 domain-containing protein [Anaerococcus sp.]